jgi:hypothetical protein
MSAPRKKDGTGNWQDKQYYKPANDKPTELITRRCLKCGKKIRTIKTLFLCLKCRTENRRVSE